MKALKKIWHMADAKAKFALKAGSLFFILLWCLAGTVEAQNARQMVRKGNDLYEKGDYTEAEIQYKKALQNDPELFEGTFNMAASMIRQKKYEPAIDQLQILASATEDKEKLGKIYHNMGNAFLASKELEKSIESYKTALRNNPNDDETRYNLAYAQKMLNDQQQQQQQNKDQNKDQQNKDDKKDQDNKGKGQQQDSDNDGISDEKEKQPDKNNPSASNKPQDSDNDGTPDYQDQDSDNDGVPDKAEAGEDPNNPKDSNNDGTPDYRDPNVDGSKNNQNQDQQQQQQQQQAQASDQISKEDAEQILRALQQDERQVQEKVKEQQKAKGRTKRVDKEW